MLNLPDKFWEIEFEDGTTTQVNEDGTKEEVKKFMEEVHNKKIKNIKESE